MSRKIKSPYELYAKGVMQALRLKTGTTMKELSAGTGYSVKKLEDLHATRNYGAHLGLVEMIKIAKFYKVPLGTFVKE